MYRKISAKEIPGNIIDMISREWMLITAGDKRAYNMMTASWGFMGELWGEDCVSVFVRPERYTMEFIDKSDYFSLSFYGDNKAIHKVCGSLSGRDVNKTEMAKLTPDFCEKAPFFCEARLVIICKKQYVAPLDKNAFTDKEPLTKWYGGGMHVNIIGKIEKVLIKNGV